MAFMVDHMPIYALFIIVVTKLQYSLTLGAPQVPCFFIFGDSLVDNGNNNELNTQAKANYPPYGIDFPMGPTGRFTNGGNAVDFLGQLLGFDTYIPPFATAQGKEIITGVNYGSASSGILSETGRQQGDNISLEKQLLNHKLTVSRIAHLLRNDTSAKQHLSKCLYYFSIGSNDYINNYFLPKYYSTSNKYTPQEYAAFLVQQYSQHLKTLYNLGARKVSVSGLGSLGCIPAIIYRVSKGTDCIDFINDAVQLFNDKLKLHVDELNQNKNTDAKYIYISAMKEGSVKQYGSGNKFVSEGCCKVSDRTGLCIAGESPCRVRALHLFYDSYHPTENVNKLVAVAAYVDILKLIV